MRPCVWRHVCETLYVRTCMWDLVCVRTLCQTLYVAACMWDPVCSSSSVLIMLITPQICLHDELDCTPYVRPHMWRSINNCLQTTTEVTYVMNYKQLFTQYNRSPSAYSAFSLYTFISIPHSPQLQIDNIYYVCRSSSDILPELQILLPIDHAMLTTLPTENRFVRKQWGIFFSNKE